MDQRASSSRTLLLASLAQVPARTRTSFELTLLIYDRKLERVSAEFRAFARQYPYRYGVESGEKLKNLSQFASHCEALSRLAASLPPRSMTALAVGGGSLGDFAGFFASVYKRGVRLVHLPTTWLAAIDSSHGGKTALNVGGAKNQIGTFYPADTTVIVRSVLASQDSARVEDAMGELAKIALIDGGAWAKALASSRLIGADLLWKFLKPAIEAKMKVVRRDPLEKTGARQILNLGHTMGHAIEAAMKLSHGASVAQGLFFALEFSRTKKLLTDVKFEQILDLLAHLGLAPILSRKPFKASALKKFLLSDKKRDRNGAVTFIFVRGFGRCERRSIPVDDVIREARRQGWAK